MQPEDVAACIELIVRLPARVTIEDIVAAPLVLLAASWAAGRPDNSLTSVRNGLDCREMFSAVKAVEGAGCGNQCATPSAVHQPAIADRVGRCLNAVAVGLRTQNPRSNAVELQLVQVALRRFMAQWQMRKGFR